jgi:hypothetical protein
MVSSLQTPRTGAPWKTHTNNGRDSVGKPTDKDINYNTKDRGCLENTDHLPTINGMDSVGKPTEKTTNTKKRGCLENRSHTNNGRDWGETNYNTKDRGCLENTIIHQQQQGLCRKTFRTGHELSGKNKLQTPRTGVS